MKTFFISQDLWDFVQSGLTPTNRQQIYEAKEEVRRDAQALYYIQQAVTPTIFYKFFDVSLAKAAWNFLEAEYNYQTRLMDSVVFITIEIPKLMLGTSSQMCFFRELPKILRDVNPAAYTPQSISIGPLHHGKPELTNMEKRKPYYAKNFLNRTQKQKDLIVHFLELHEESIRQCYSKPSDLNSREYVEMIMLNSFFIFEFFIWYEDKTAPEYADESLLHAGADRRGVRGGPWTPPAGWKSPRNVGIEDVLKQ